MDKELLYDSSGRPTELNEKISLRSLEMAKEILDGGYVTKVDMTYVSKDAAVISVTMQGKLTKSGINKKKVLPFKVNPDTKSDLQRTLIEWALDEVELELGRRITGWKAGTISAQRLNLSTDGYVLDTFKVTHIKGLK